MGNKSNPFFELVAARLEAGRKEYGDRSFERKGEELIDEIIEELADVCGWSYILFDRLQKLREKIAKLEGKS